jgi:hypothetical protein
VVEGVGDHRFDDAQLVGHARRVRQQLRKLGAALAVSGELELRPEQSGIRVDERRPVALQQPRGRQRAVQLGERRLVVEQLEVARRAGHEQEDHVLRPRGEVGHLRRQRVGRRRRRRGVSPLGEQLAQRHGAQADAALLEEPAPTDLRRVGGSEAVVLAIHGATLRGSVHVLIPW